jgi:hypothetical protein
VSALLNCFIGKCASSRDQGHRDAQSQLERESTHNTKDRNQPVLMLRLWEFTQWMFHLPKVLGQDEESTRRDINAIFGFGEWDVNKS